MHPSFLPDFPRPLVFAHRGLSSLCPENTMAAYRAARDAGIPGIELDVHLTRDHRLVVFHDDTTKRIARTQGGAPGEPSDASIEASDYAYLATLDIGSWKGPAYSGERMPLLDEVLGEFGVTQYFDIEIKSRTAGDAGLERILAESIIRLGMERRCIVSSFNPFALRRFKKIAAGIPTAVIWSESAELYWFLRRGEGRWIGAVDILKPEHALLKRRRLFADLRRPVLPWTIDTESEVQRVLGLGAVGIISNCPERVARFQASVS